FTYPVPPERLDVFSQFLVPANCRPRHHRNIETTEMMLQLVAAGRGVSAIPDWLVRREAAALGVRAVRIGHSGGSTYMHVENSSSAWLADDTASKIKAEARAFCLRMINEFYGIGYTPAWHSDLDSLLKAAPENWFSNGERGGFLLVRDDAGHIIASGGHANWATSHPIFMPMQQQLTPFASGEAKDTASSAGSHIRHQEERIAA
uniref:LysR_substrate domain-containing protein n=1 Tax=Globodera pallida TaxID=36090 RepID=A0A183CSW3_GLOPA